MNPPETLQSLIRRPIYSDRFREILHDRTDQFVSSLLQIGASMPDVEPKSILAAAMTAAALDLPINKNLGFAWIIPYADNKAGRKLAQFQIGWKGYVQLALRTGQYTRMNARSLNQDCFVGWDDMGQPILDWSKFDPSLPVSLYWFGFDMGPVKQRFMWTKDQTVQHARKYSQSFRKGADIWKSEEDKMHLKGVVKISLARWGILSIHMQTAIQNDSAVKLDVDAKPEYLDNAEPLEIDDAKSIRTGLREAVDKISSPEASNLVDGKASGNAEKSDGIPGSPSEVAKPSAQPRKHRTLAPQAEMPLDAGDRAGSASIVSPKDSAAPNETASIQPSATPQRQFAAMCESNSITFDEFKSWAIGEQYPIRDLDSMAGFEQLPERMCRLWVKDMKFTVSSIKREAK